MTHDPAARRPRLGAGVTAVMVAAGVLFATSAGTADGTSLRNDGTDLPGLVRGQTQRLDERNQEISALRTEVEQLTGSVDDVTVQRLEVQAAQLSGPAQMQAVAGPGLQVTLDDAPPDRPVPDGISPDLLVVHQQDIQAVVNALWAAGAEAMTLMDQRVISTSAVRCVGSTLRLQGQVYSPPYVIRAIGDPQRLKQALDRSSDVAVYRQYVRAVGLGYAVTERRSIPMPAFQGSVELDFATVLDAARKAG